MSLYELQNNLSPEQIDFFSTKSVFRDKYQFLEGLLHRCLSDASQARGYTQIWSSLKNREMASSTGIGKGIALPYCYCNTKDLYCRIGVLAEPIEFNSIDDIPVQIVFLILFPKKNKESIAPVLGSIARIFNVAKLRSQILKAKKKETVAKLLIHELDRDVEKISQTTLG